MQCSSNGFTTQTTCLTSKSVIVPIIFQDECRCSYSSVVCVQVYVQINTVNCFNYFETTGCSDTV